MQKDHHLITDPEKWLAAIASSRGEDSIVNLRHVMAYYTPAQHDLFLKGMAIADILFELKLDNETLAAAMLYPALQMKELHLDSVPDLLGENSKKLLHDVLQMQSLNKLQLSNSTNYHAEKLRKMLLAMVSDVRAVLIVLAARLWELYDVKKQSPAIQRQLAQETTNIYAPLANRLGVWQLKWEMEDLCLRYLEPAVYADIAKWLASRRVEREQYIETFTATLEKTLQHAQVKQFKLMGRVKHIYSIYKKMQRKNAPINEIYDISALRVLVESVDDCYKVLSVLQNTWQQVHSEFDDYIMHPKPNGYRSIHTVVIGPADKYVEIQIRTQQMHHESELGVAAHWRYKEGVLQTSSYDAKIALLRQVFEWQKEVTNQPEDKSLDDLFADRVYVFTPLGDIVELENNATPLDFAYHIHSEVGHRCRGAKVDGNIVPLTYTLQTGQRIEILTAKHANPSRDWLNPHYGYIKTSRARAKVAHWFRVLDSEKEHAVTEPVVKHEQASHPVTTKRVHLPAQSSRIQISGVNNLLTNIARCCKPLPGDPVVGYITQMRGVTIHRLNCKNVGRMQEEQSQRIVAVDWGDTKKIGCPVDLILRTESRSDLIKVITSTLGNDGVAILAIHVVENSKGDNQIHLTIRVEHIEELQAAFTKLKQIEGVHEVLRK